MAASLAPTTAISMWAWLVDERPFSPLNNIESLMFPAAAASCSPDDMDWNELKGSWNLVLQTLGLGRNLVQPSGLSQAPTDIWGRDFKPVGGDFGDPDLEQAITYARSRGKLVLAVIAGHLHLRTKQGQNRQWLVVQDGTHYINAARVPRIFESGGRIVHHHVRLMLAETAVSVAEILV